MANIIYEEDSKDEKDYFVLFDERDGICLASSGTRKRKFWS